MSSLRWTSAGGLNLVMILIVDWSAEAQKAQDRLTSIDAAREDMSHQPFLERLSIQPGNLERQSYAPSLVRLSCQPHLERASLRAPAD